MEGFLRATHSSYPKYHPPASVMTRVTDRRTGEVPRGQREEEDVP